MRHFVVWVIVVFICWNDAIADIAPNPIVVKGIYTNSECKIRMVSEVVSVTMSNDSSYVECVFEMLNYGDSTTIEVGFPVMNFHYFSLYQYSENDRANFNIYVDGNILSEDDIKVPQELEDVYREYVRIDAIDKQYKEKTDSLFSVYEMDAKKSGFRSAWDSLEHWRNTMPQLSSELRNRFDEKIKDGKYPWYVWNVSFEKDEKKYIKVTYSLPSGSGHSHKYRYFKYLLSTGAGWYKDIGKADVTIKLENDIRLKNIEEISPAGYTINKAERTITWSFTSLEPTVDHDIYIQYYNRKEKSNSKKRLR